MELIKKSQEFEKQDKLLEKEKLKQKNISDQMHDQKSDVKDDLANLTQKQKQEIKALRE